MVKNEDNSETIKNLSALGLFGVLGVKESKIINPCYL